MASVLVSNSSFVAPEQKKIERRRIVLGYLSHLAWYLAYRVRHLFFNPHPFQSMDQVVVAMKQSLSKTLVDYYPVAGRLVVNEARGIMELDCNNAGIMFIEAKTSMLVETVESAEDQVLEQLAQTPGFEGRLCWPWPSDAPLLFVQVTEFGNGGFCVCLRYNHQVLDGTSIWNFFKSWAEVSQGDPISIPPQIIDWPISVSSKRAAEEKGLATAPPYFLQRLPRKEVLSPQKFNTNLARRRFSFSRSMVQRLRSENPGFSTFHLLSSYIWCKVTTARGLQHNDATKLLFAISCRERVKDPPLTSAYLGFAASVTATRTVPAGWIDVLTAGIIKGAVLIKESVDKFDHGLIREAVEHCYSVDRLHAYVPKVTPGRDLFIGSSFKFPVYEEFAWGVPTGLSTTQPPKDGHVYYFPGSSGKGSIDAFIVLDHASMQKLAHII